MSIRTKIVRVDWSNGDPVVAEMPTYGGVAASLRALALTYPPPLTPPNGYLAWRAYCEAAGSHALADPACPKGWTRILGVPPEGSTSSGSGPGWDPLIGGVAFRVANASALGEELWAEFYPDQDLVTTRTVQLLLCNDSGVPANGVVLEFMFGRSEIVKVAVDQAHVFFSHPDKAFGIVFAFDLAPCAKVTLDIEYRFDPPAFRTTAPPAAPELFVTWLARTGAVVRKPPSPFQRLPNPLAFDGSPAAEQAVAAHVGAHDLQPAAIRTRRERDIDATEGPRKTYKRFFYELDVSTNPKLGVAKGGTQRLYFPLKRTLQARFLARAQALAAGGHGPVFSQLSLELLRVDAAQVAASLQRLINKHFESLLVTAQGRSGSFEEALEMFASGALTSFDGHGGPDGPLVFALGEFVLLLQDLAHSPPQHDNRPIVSKAKPIDWAFWRQLEPVMCRVAEIFARCYHRPLPANDRSFAAYTPNDNPNGRRGLDPYAGKAGGAATTLASLRAAWANTDVRREFARTVAAALRGELSVKLAGPKALPEINPQLAGRTLGCANEIGLGRCGNPDRRRGPRRRSSRKP